MRKIFSILVLHFLITCTSLAGINGIEIHLLNKSKLELSPGTASNTVVQLSNNSDEDKQVTLKITYPSGWSQIMSSKSVLVKKNSFTNKIVSFHIPESTQVGEYSISIEAYDELDNQKIGDISILIYISPRYEVNVKKFNAPDRIFDGDVFQIKYLIQNMSNLETNIKTTIVNREEIIKETYRLAPDSFVIVSYSVIARNIYQFYMRRNVTLTYSIEGNPDSESVVTHIYDILPSSQLKFDPFERFPIQVSTTLATNNHLDKRGYAAMFDISGKGWLSPEKERSVSFQLRGPNRRGEPVLGTNDSYFVKYSTKKNAIIVGDNNYRLSDLTESSRYGRGGRFEQTRNKVTVGAFINFPRFYPDLKRVSSVYASYLSDTRYKLSAGFLSKAFVDKTSANIVTLSGVAQPYKWGNIEAEIASGLENGKMTKAFQSKIKAGFSFFSAFVNYTKADADFPGYFSNTKNLGTGFNFKIKKRSNVSLYYISNYANMALDTMYTNAPYSNNMDISYSFRIHKNHSLRLSAIRRSSEDRMEPKLFHFYENTTRLSLNNKIGKVDVNISGEIGKIDNQLQQNEGDPTNSVRANLSFKYKISKRTTFDAFVNYHGNQRYLGSELKDFYYGGALNTDVKRLSLVAKYQSNYQIEEYYKDRSILDLSIKYHLAKQHDLAVVTYYNLVKNSYDKKELKILFKYTYTLLAPLSKKENIGSLKGRIINNGIPNVQGIVLMLNGNMSVTNKDGYFNFPLVKAGEAYLFIDDSKTGVNSIPEKAGPYKVDILPGQENYFEIGYTQSAKIKGKIIIEEDERKDEKDYIAIKENLTSLIIEAKKRDELFRVVSHKDGTFNFNDLRPGNWVVKVYATGIPSGYELITSTFNVDLMPGIEKVLEVRLKKKARKVKFQKSF